MGVYYSAGIIVGLPKRYITNRKLFFFTGDKSLEDFPPYYDCGEEDIILCGFSAFTSDDYDHIELIWNQEKIDGLKTKFKTLTGQDAKVWLTPIGC